MRRGSWSNHVQPRSGEASCQQPIYNKVTRCDYDSQSRLLAVGFSRGVLMLFEPLGTAIFRAGMGLVYQVSQRQLDHLEIMFLRCEFGFPVPN